MSNKPTHGGARKGAGRPSKGKTARIACRVPVEIKQFLERQEGTETESILKAIKWYYKI